MYLSTAKINFQSQKYVNQSLVLNQDLNFFSVSVSVHSIDDIPLDNAPPFQIVLHIDNLSTKILLLLVADIDRPDFAASVTEPV